MIKALEDRFYHYVEMFESGDFRLYHAALAFARNHELPVSELRDAEREGLKFLLNNIIDSDPFPDRRTKYGNPVFEVRF